MNPFCPIPTAIKELKEGKMLIVVDSLDRENQGDIIFPAETVTPQKVNFLMLKCRGMVCVAITKEQALRLDLPLMVEPVHNTEATNVQFTVTVDAVGVQSFGISASDRAKTIRVLADSISKQTDLVRPGHIFPLLARDGGVGQRPGHTEAAVELSQLAGFTRCGVLCEILRDDGEVAKLPELITFSKKYGVPIVSIADLVMYVKTKHSPQVSGKTIVKTASSLLPTEYGLFQITVYKSIIDNREHLALFLGRNINKEPMLTRIHSQCLTGDTLLSLKCDCRDQLHLSMKIISQNKSGLIIYLNQEGRGIGLSNKIKAYALQNKGLDTVEANTALHLPTDGRDYKIAAEILQDQQITHISLLTNNPAKAKDLVTYGVTIVNQIPLEVPSNDINKHYLATKKRKFGHILTQV